MTILLQQIFELIQLLSSERGRKSIAWGVALGFILGMAPSYSPQFFLVFLLLIVFRVQLAAALTSAFFFEFAAHLLDPLFHILGQGVLSAPSLKPLFTTLYNAPIVPWTRFYNTVVMGSALASLALAPLIYFFSLWFVDRYRSQIVERWRHSKLFRLFKATILYKWYVKYEEYYG